MEITFNKIFVIESLPADEPQTGSDLHNDIIRRRLWAHENITSEICKINSKQEFYDLMVSIENQVENENVIPYLHFETHGNLDGFFLNSAEQVHWVELNSNLVEINFKTKNKLWISLATCYGAYIYTTYSLVRPAPFYGYIGALTELHIEDIPVSFERYFEVLLNSFDMEAAVKALNLHNPKLPVEYRLYSSKDVFEKAYSDYEEKTFTEKGLDERADRIISLGKRGPNNLPNLPKKELKEFIKIKLKEKKQLYREKYFNKFMMIDEYPEIKERFVD